ncbi:MAG: DUF6712 family protein [Bacteroidota bacterium]
MSYFKITTTPNPPSPEVQHTDIGAFWPGVNANTAWETIEPFVEQAEELFLIPHVGREFFDHLDEQYNGNGIDSESKLTRVFHLLRTALASYISYIALPELALRVGDAGIRENNNRESTSARQWVYKENMWKAQLKAFQFLDKALKIMEEEVESGNTDFNTFKNSSTYTISRRYFIASATALARYFNIANSRQTYVKLRPYMEKVQERDFRPLLGDELYDLLASQHLDGNLTEANEKLMQSLRRELAELTVAECIGDLNFIQDGSGWVTVENNDEGRPAGTRLSESIQQMQTKAEQNAKLFRMATERLLYANLEDYPLFRDSTANESTDDDDPELDPECLVGAIDL